jgi:hypothetical protein
MENKFISDLEQQLDDIDIDSIKLDAVIQLKTWQKKMFSLIDKIYSTRLDEIDEIAFNIENEIKEKQNQLEQQMKTNDKTILLKLQHEIDQFKSDITINQTIPENLHHLIEQTIRIKRDKDQDDDDDDLVIIDVDENEDDTDEKVVVVLPTTHSESRVSKIFNSEPVQQALAVTLVKTLTQMGTMAATSTTTIAATTIAKTALLTTAYGIGRIAMGTSKKIWSLVVSSDDL